MRLDKLAVTAQEAFQASMGVAGDAQSSTIEPIHLLKAMLDASENNLSAIIKRIGADPAQLSQNVDAAIAAMSIVSRVMNFLFCIGLGFYIGYKMDAGEDLVDLLDNLLPPYHK